MDPQPLAPPVVAVVVANQPGAWFEDALVAIGNQDYPNQSVLVLDSATDTDPEASRRVGAVLPDAFLRRVDAGVGFAGAANDVLSTVEGASFLVFCHDDVSPEPDAIRLMVEEALRSNAGIVAPKVVEWDHPDRLMEVGLSVDKTGACGTTVERGELDQEQHDAVRDVFAVSTTCLLVRSDLFGELGGFDAVMGDHGADVDLCWRAQVAGARVLVAPAARVRHLAGGVQRPEQAADDGALAARHHVRAMLKSYSLPHLLRVVPQAAVITMVEAVAALAGRRWSEARQLVGAWWWNLRRLRTLRPLRRAVSQSRAVPDTEVRRLQVRGSVRLTNYLQRRLHTEERARALVAAGQELVESVGRGPARAATALLAVLVLGILIGSRHLLTGRIPAVGQLSPWPGAATFLTHFVDGWRTTGVGSAAPAPPIFGLIGAAGVVLGGHMDLLQKIVLFAMWPIGALGAWRFGRPLQSPLPRVVGVLAYLAVPLSYNSMARGRLGGLVAYAAAPWALTILARHSRLEPWGDPDDASPLWYEALGFALLVALVCAFVPAFALAVVLVAMGLVLGSLVVGGSGSATRALASASAGVGAAFVLLLPWSADLLLPGSGSTLFGVAGPTSASEGLGAMLRFDVGPVGGSPLGWAFLVAAALPLAVGRGWRLAWAVRLWFVALTCIGTAWAAGQGWLPIRLQAPDVLLAPAAFALAAAAGLGAAAFEVDLRRSRFGWRQAASLAAGATMVVVALPVLVAARDGRWHLPATEVARSVDLLGQQTGGGDFRVLWLGEPELLPLDGWSLGNGASYATSRGGAPDFTDLLPGRPSGATEAIADALAVARSASTARLGRLLAPMAIRYVVVPRQLEAGSATGPSGEVARDLSKVLQSQLDLRLLPGDAAAVVYENTAWAPIRSVLSEAGSATVAAAATAELGAGADLSGAAPVLSGKHPVRFKGEVTAGTVLVAESPSSRWQLSVGGRRASRADAFDAANTFEVAVGGQAELRYRTPFLRYVLLLAALALWVFAVRTLTRQRRRIQRGRR